MTSKSTESIVTVAHDPALEDPVLEDPAHQDPVVKDWPHPRRLVVPLDGSEFAARALAPAKHLASVFGIPIRVVAVPTVQNSDSFAQCLREQIAPFDVESLRIEPDSMVTRPGGIAGHILSNLEPEDVVVLASTSRARTSHVIGSVAEKIIDASQNFTVVIGPHYTGMDHAEQGPVVLALKGSQQVVAPSRIAIMFARAFEIGIEIRHATDRWLMAGLVAAGHEDAPGEELEIIRNLAAEIAWEMEGPVTFAAGDSNHFDQQIDQIAEAREASLIVLAEDGPHGLRRLAEGNVAMSIIHHAECPVVVAPEARWGRS